MRKLIMIKFGGSLISNKTKENVARLDVINNLSSEIKSVESDKVSFIITTGAGGFGHPVAKKYENNLEKGAPYIKEAVKKLNQIVVSSLNNVGVSAISVEPSEVAEYEDGKMISLLHGYIVKLLEENIIPVFHADLVNDKKMGISILSMDKFLVDTAINLKSYGCEIEKVIFAGTTAGVVSQVGTTIPKITKESFSDMDNIFFEGKGIDVTGGMKGKVGECLRLVDKKIPCTIIDGQKENNLRKAILGEEIVGTMIIK